MEALNYRWKTRRLRKIAKIGQIGKPVKMVRHDGCRLAE
jgi:hypothetical protein